MTTTTPPGHTWTCQRPGQTPMTVVCPNWCEIDHVDDATGMVEDVTHVQTGPRIRIDVDHNGGEKEKWKALEASMAISPYSGDPRTNVPHVDVELVYDVWIEGMDPDGLAAFIHKLSTHVDNLRLVHTQLVKAVAEHQDGAL